jgi:hypothetical protein
MGAFVLSAARCGSTLVRRILESHPDVACPPETNVAVVMATLVQTVDAVEQGIPGSPAIYGYQEGPSDKSRALCVKILEETLGSYASLTGKQLWCDKSLPSLDHAELLALLFPEVRFLCLVRNWMDFVASAMEASPWGYSSYGFGEYVNGGSALLGLSRYWIDKVGHLAYFAERNRERSLLIRYEDLVCSTEEIVERIWAHLGVARAPSLLSERLPFHVDTTLGLGDYKSQYIESVDDKAIGRGWRTPPFLLPEPMRLKIEQVQSDLGYPPLLEHHKMASGAWPRRSGAQARPDRRAARKNKDVLELRSAFVSRLGRPDRILDRVIAHRMAPRTLKIIVFDAEAEFELELPVRLPFRYSGPELSKPCRSVTIVTNWESLDGVVQGTVNAGIAMRQQHFNIVDMEGGTAQSLDLAVMILTQMLRGVSEA